VGKAIYAIDAFPEDDQLWRIDWIGGVRYNASVPSEPLIDICLAQLPSGEANPLSANSRASETKAIVTIGVGLLPYISIASVIGRLLLHLLSIVSALAQAGIKFSSSAFSPGMLLLSWSTVNRLKGNEAEQLSMRSTSQRAGLFDVGPGNGW